MTLIRLVGLMLLLSVFSAQAFDALDGQKALMQVKVSLTKKQTIAALKQKLNDIEEKQEDAEACIKTTSEQIKKIDATLNSSEFVSDPDKTAREDYRYLTKKRAEFSKKASQCRVFSLKSEDALTLLKIEIEKLDNTKSKKVGAVVISFIALAFFVLLIWLVRSAIALVNNNQWSLIQRFRYFLGVKPHKKLPELALLKFALMAGLTVVLVFVLLAAWGFPHRMFEALYDGFMDGFEIGGLQLYPFRILLAAAIFSLIILLSRWISTFVARKNTLKKDTDQQVAIASILTYVLFAIGLLASLLVAGVNFTGLAIIAGALSVGIGLGLQNIVANFFSGLILLLEKPIKPGDRVIVGDTEGFVKKVRLRSTQISTMAKEDVIIPNSELINTQVINYMFRDTLWRVACRVGVAYGSDVALVKKVLLAVAADHEDICQTEPNEPIVLFMAFGNSSLDFELWCVITDVNKKYIIQSELNSEVDRRFRENHITIAFPQRDLHIKSVPPGDDAVTKS